MKKILVILAVLLAIFALASCKQEPKEEAKPDGTPVVENGGVITVGVGEGAEWNSAGRFQFFIDEAVGEYDTIDFLLKMSDAFDKIVVRSDDAAASWPKYATVTVTSDMLNEDGWYVISDVTASVASDTLGFSAMLKDGETQNETLSVQIKNLKINGKLIDFSAYAEDAESYVLPFAGALAPSKITATIEK